MLHKILSSTKNIKAGDTIDVGLTAIEEEVRWQVGLSNCLTIDMTPSTGVSRTVEIAVIETHLYSLFFLGKSGARTVRLNANLFREFVESLLQDARLYIEKVAEESVQSKDLQAKLSQSIQALKDISSTTGKSESLASRPDSKTLS